MAQSAKEHIELMEKFDNTINSIMPFLKGYTRNQIDNILSSVKSKCDNCEIDTTSCLLN